MVYSMIPAMMTQCTLLWIFYSKLDWGFDALLVANSAMFIVRYLASWALVTKSGKI